MSKFYRFLSERISPSQLGTSVVAVAVVFLFIKLVLRLFAFVKYVKQINQIVGPTVSKSLFWLGNIDLLMNSHHSKRGDMILAFSDSLSAFTKVYPQQMIRMWLSYKPILCISDASSAEVSVFIN